MILPGKIWHLEQTLDTESNLTLNVTVKKPLDFKEISVSPKMLTDHFPNNVCDILTNLESSQRSRGGNGAREWE